MMMMMAMMMRDVGGMDRPCFVYYRSAAAFTDVSTNAAVVFCLLLVAVCLSLSYE